MPIELVETFRKNKLSPGVEGYNCTIRSWDELGVLGLHVAPKKHELRVTAAREAFWSLRKISIARSLALSVRWTRWKAEVAPELALGVWSWRWSSEVWRIISTTVIRMLRIMAHSSKRLGEPGRDWHIRCVRDCQTYKLGGGTLGHQDLVCQAAKRWEAWIAPDTRCVLVRALHLRARLCSESAQELCRMTGLVRTVKLG